MIGSLLFNIAFWLWGVVMALLALPILLMPRKVMVRHAERWERGIQWLLRHLVGLDYRIRGAEHRAARHPDNGGVIFAIKHQSAWDTITTHLLIDDPAIVLKQELTRIPIFGPCLLHAGMIKIDRGHGTKALRSLIEGGRVAIARGSPVVIFPEGTRTPPGEKQPYHPGVAALYKQLALPVVPVALNSGLFWGRRSFAKKSGTILVEFLEPIQPGMDRKAFMAALEESIEGATDRLIAEAKAAALSV
ncbi:MAG: lysophospholipid acyltransferase family protein [Geminicoccaceae bacterium]